MKQVLLITLGFVVLNGCYFADKDITYNAVVLDAATKVPVSNLPVAFVRKAPSYMEKDKLNTSTVTDGQGRFSISTCVVDDRRYDVNVNVHIPPCKVDTFANSFKFLPAGITRMGADMHLKQDTFYVKPSGVIRFEIPDSIYAKHATSNFIIQSGASRISLGNGLEFPTPITGWAPQGIVDINRMYFIPNATYSFEFFKVTGGNVVPVGTYQIFVPNAFAIGSTDCDSELVYTFTN
jgi:hypothetical protein